MLIVIPTLTVNDPDVSLAIGARMIHNLAVKNATDPSTYETGLQLAISIVQKELPLLYIGFNGVATYLDESRYNALRSSEMSEFAFGSIATTGIRTIVIYDQKYDSVQGALYSIYTTTFVIGLLLVSLHSPLILQRIITVYSLVFITFQLMSINSLLVLSRNLSSLCERSPLTLSV